MENQILTQFLNLGAIGAAFFLMLKNQLISFRQQNEYFVEKMNDIALSVKNIANNIGKTILDKEQTLMIFNIILFEHIERNINYIEEVLTNNHLTERKDQISRNICNKIMFITQEEASKLSQFNTPAGDLGALLLENVDYPKFTGEVLEIMFSINDIETKINDVRILMNSYVSALIKIINEKIKENTL